jgi:hypothetical protein
MDGKVVGMVGHLHHTGRSIQSTDETRNNRLICRSYAMEEMDHVVACPCTNYLPVRIWRGDKIRLTSAYNSDVPRDDVMGIMLGYVYHDLIIARQRNCERPRRRLPGYERRLQRLAISKRCRRQVLGPHRLDVKQLGDMQHSVSVSV